MNDAEKRVESKTLKKANTSFNGFQA